MKRNALFSLLVFLLLLLFCASAAAAEKTMTAVCPSVCSETVEWQSGKSGYYLCLPGGWDASAITLSMEGGDCIFLGKEKIRIPLGEPADLTPYLGERLPLWDAEDRRIGNFQVLQGSPVLSLMFTADAKEFAAVNKSKKNVITSAHLTAVEADGSVSCDGSLSQFKGRGNNTFSYPKKPYEFKLEKKAALGGIDKAKTWILLANYADVSLLRNQIVLDLARETGLPYAVECTPADVWMNGQYLGLYLMTEKIQIKKNRVNITDLEDLMEEMNDAPLDSYPKFNLKNGPLPFMKGYDIPNEPEDITGGYIAMIEKKYRQESLFKPGIATKGKARIYVRIKEPTTPSRAQVEYFGALVNQMYSAVRAADGTDPETGKHYSEFLDVSSFAIKYLIDDLSKNYDVAAGSQYFFKDSDRVDPLIYAGPAWDYDLSFGNMPDPALSPTGSFALLNPSRGNFFAQLGKHEDFKAVLREKYAEVLRPALAILTGEAEEREGGVLRSVEHYREAIALSAAMNEVRRGAGTTAKVAPEAGKDFKTGVAKLEKWIETRAKDMEKRYAEK